MATSVASLKKQLQQRYPKMWVKDGAEFDSRHKDSLWTGEGSYTEDDTPLFEFYGIEPLYIFGVHKDLADFLAAKGYFAEAHDGGTFFIWRI